jgi:hypothetical protein
MGCPIAGKGSVLTFDTLKEKPGRVQRLKLEGIPNCQISDFQIERGDGISKFIEKRSGDVQGQKPEVNSPFVNSVTSC